MYTALNGFLKYFEAAIDFHPFSCCMNVIEKAYEMFSLAIYCIVSVCKSIRMEI